MTYDPEARRDTPLALKLKERIRRDGPITVAEYMAACLQDPEHGYYRKKAAIGANGDFVTAPEISQVFGELIGLWCAVVWQQMGSPDPFNLNELGPGRGTLMRDALRAARLVPEFRSAARVQFFESNPQLRAIQESTLAETGISPLYVGPRWNRYYPETYPTIWIANEFVDCIPVEQFSWKADPGGGSWLRRIVQLGAEDRLCFGTAPAGGEHLPAKLSKKVEAPAEGAILEAFANVRNLVSNIDVSWASWAKSDRVAALFIDYGYTSSGIGDTLQAVRNHAHEHPLTSPGEADLTAQVDFETLGEAMRTAGLAVDGPVTQANFLGSLGIMQRAAKLMGANPAKAHEIEAGVARLMAVPGMGDRFKAIGIRSANLPPLPGF